MLFGAVSFVFSASSPEIANFVPAAPSLDNMLLMNIPVPGEDHNYGPSTINYTPGIANNGNNNLNYNGGNRNSVTVTG